jgi:hypothetical protein
LYIDGIVDSAGILAGGRAGGNEYIHPEGDGLVLLGLDGVGDVGPVGQDQRHQGVGETSFRPDAQGVLGLTLIRAVVNDDVGGAEEFHLALGDLLAAGAGQGGPLEGEGFFRLLPAAQAKLGGHVFVAHAGQNDLLGRAGWAIGQDHRARRLHPQRQAGRCRLASGRFRRHCPSHPDANCRQDQCS